MYKRLILLFWLGVILFPVAWLVQQTRVFSYWFDVLTPEWVHIIAHSFLFAVLALVLLSLSDGKLAVGKMLLLIFIVGMLQESIQMIAIGKHPGGDELFDVGVDLMGGLCGLIGFLLLRKVRIGLQRLSPL